MPVRELGEGLEITKDSAAFLLKRIKESYRENQDLFKRIVAL